MRSWTGLPPSRKTGMSLPLQAESPVLVTNIKDCEVELAGHLHCVVVVRNRPRTLGTVASDPRCKRATGVGSSKS
jgi:hypothetical protein